MGRKSKSDVLERQSALAKTMAEGRGYAWELMWYENHYGLSEKAFQKDKTVIYLQWKLDNAKELDDKKNEIIARLNAARLRAIDAFDVKAEIAAIKLEAQLLGVLNKSGEVVIENAQIIQQQNNMNFQHLSVDEIKELLIKNDNE